MPIKKIIPLNILLENNDVFILLIALNNVISGQDTAPAFLLNSYVVHFQDFKTNLADIYIYYTYSIRFLKMLLSGWMLINR